MGFIYHVDTMQLSRLALPVPPRCPVIARASDTHRRASSIRSRLYSKCRDPAQGRYFCQAAGLRPDVYLRSPQYRPPHPECHPELGRQGRYLSHSVKYRAGYSVPVAWRFNAPSLTAARMSAPVSAAMNAFQRPEDPLAFCRQIHA